MTLKEANYQVEKLTNDIEYLLKEKELLELSVGVKATCFDKVLVDGGKRVDRLLEYVDNKEYLQLDEKIRLKEEQRSNLETWISNELKILNKYSQVEQLIVYYKENTNSTWRFVSQKVHYSERQCRRIYQMYKCKRNV